jgi:hypothetical protein
MALRGGGMMGCSARSFTRQRIARVHDIVLYISLHSTWPEIQCSPLGSLLHFSLSIQLTLASNNSSLSPLSALVRLNALL